jgi:HEPN domain-containing protein
MKDETSAWLGYADENLFMAELALAHGRLHACAFNCHQAVEKYLKALTVEHGLSLKRTHVILQLRRILELGGMADLLSEEDCDLLDTAFLPSRYPLQGVWTAGAPSKGIPERWLQIARDLRAATRRRLQMRD